MQIDPLLPMAKMSREELGTLVPLVLPLETSGKKVNNPQLKLRRPFLDS